MQELNEKMNPETYLPVGPDDYGFLFQKSELVPAIVQDSKTHEVLMLAYMNAESFALTLQTGKCTFYSRSRKKIWCKGETSGHFQMVDKILFDCDCDTLLFLVRPIGPACHTQHKSCFYREFPFSQNKE